MTQLQQRQKIAVLGGGMAALTTVFELTNQPDWQGKYEITVYQMGWRLGGKGASGRNADISSRIEEHGLHVFMGVYENTFQVMRQCYQELARPNNSPLASWTDAFKPQSLIAYPEPVNEQRIPWLYEFPENSELPGDGNGFPNIWGYVRLLVKFMVKQVSTIGIGWQELVDREDVKVEHLPTQIQAWLNEQNLNLDCSHPIPEAGYLQIAEQIVQQLPKDPQQHQTVAHDALLWFVAEFRQWFWQTTKSLLVEHHKFRRVWILLDLASTVVAGIFTDNVLFTGFDAIDDYDLREWFTRHGASTISTNSVMIQGLYDFVFAYENGDVTKPNFAAGVGLRCLLRMALTYRGAFFWKMQAGMGDVIFAPLYEVLKKRGVQFKFFHRVKNLGLSEDGKTIERIAISRQVTVKNDEYQPLVEVKELPCWPSTPLYEQLIEGDTLQAQGINLESAWTPWSDVEEITLQAGQDFDLIVLGISIAALKHICSELIAVSPAWKDMISHVKTVQTQALQVWMQPSLPELGWTLPSALVDGYEHPYNSWADMSHLIEQENWSVKHKPGSIAYFCGPLEDAALIPPSTEYSFPTQEKERAKTLALNWFREHIAGLWPNMKVTPTQPEPDWHLLVDIKDRKGSDRFAGQYYRANVDPTERYVLAVKGSTKYRLRVDESGFENLYLTGDWTRTGINMGSIESTVISGRQAARAIAGYPQFIPGEFDL